MSAVDDSLPHSSLPTVEVGVSVQLIASPSHPTSFIGSDPMAVGEVVRIIGADPSAQWLLVDRAGQIGWMPTFYSRTNIGRLAPAVTIDPLPDNCTKYLGATVEAGEVWDSYGDSAIIIIGSILRPQAADAFDDATLDIGITGAGVVTAADYVHLLLTRRDAVVLFGFAVDDLEDASRVTLDLADGVAEKVILQAAYFANSCPEDVPVVDNGFTDSLPVGAYRRAVSKPTPAPPTSAPTRTAATPEIEQATPIPADATPVADSTPIVRRSGPPDTPRSLAANIEAVLLRWDEIHHAADRTLDDAELTLVLAGEALEQQRETLETLRKQDCYWNFVDLDEPEVLTIRELSATVVVVDTWKHWDGDLYCKGNYVSASSFNDPFYVRYRMERTDAWRVVEKEVIEEDGLMADEDAEEGERSTSRPNANQASPDRVRDSLIQKSRQSSVYNEYPDQAIEFVDVLMEHLDEFQMANIGVTEASMRAALERRDAGDRLNSLINEIWDDWSDNARDRGFNVWTTDPGGMNFSPFRQLVIRLTQDRQGRLSDSQQHALHNYFTRSESADIWQRDPDAVIGAINRESFRWP